MTLFKTNYETAEWREDRKQLPLFQDPLNLILELAIIRYSKIDFEKKFYRN